jgi:hypothetical protein
MGNVDAKRSWEGDFVPKYGRFAQRAHPDHALS